MRWRVASSARVGRGVTCRTALARAARRAGMLAVIATIAVVAAAVADPVRAEGARDGTGTRREEDARRRGGRALIERWERATPEERERMRGRLRRRLEDATPRERRRFGLALRALERRLPERSALERLVLLRGLRELPEDERASFRRRLARIDAMSPEERSAFHDEIDAMIAGVEGEVERLERNRARWEAMSEAEREEYRGQMERLRDMTPEERRALFESIGRGREQ